MKINTIKSLFAFFIPVAIGTISTSLLAQNVGINTTGAPPDPSAGLDVNFNNKGLLIPRLTTVQMNAIPNPATSLLIYNTTTNCFMFYTGTQWQTMACSCLGAPSAPGFITGTVTVCSGDTGITYSIIPVGGATSYIWNAPPGATITSGQGTTGITVNFAGASGNISVSAVNSCGTGPANTEFIMVSTAPGVPANINGSAGPSVSSNGNVYSVSPVAGATGYKWTITGSGDSITAGQGTNSITVSFGSTPSSYTICVYDSNSCGKSPYGPCLVVTTTNCTHGTLTFNYTGNQQSWAVPGCANSVTLQLYGAQGQNSCVGGGGGTGGNGGAITGVLNGAGGQTLFIYVGGQNGWNGGGAVSAVAGAGCLGGYGGGASDIRMNGIDTSHIIIIAGGGGGGGGGDGSYSGGNGGAGGGLAGDSGTASAGCGSCWIGRGGQGGSQVAGGAAGCGGCSCSNGYGYPGSLFQGGNGCTNDWKEGGGGGGGYYGGGGGASDCANGGGGGGSNWSSAAISSVTNVQGYQSGNGLVIITY